MHITLPLLATDCKMTAGRRRVRVCAQTYLNLATMYAAVMRDSGAALAILEWADRVLAAGHGELIAMDRASLAAHVLELVR